MSLDNFVNKFVVSENEIYGYTKREKKEFRYRLQSALSKYMYDREKKLYDHIHYLKRKNKKLENDYDMISNIAISNIDQEIVNEISTMDTKDLDYDSGYKMILWSLVRMICFIYLGFFVVQVYDNLIR